jgi:hypothetical protein
MAIATTNPATGEVVKSFEPLTGAQRAEVAVGGFRVPKPSEDFVRGTCEEDDARGRDFGKWLPVRACLSVASSTQATGANSPCMGFANL